MNKRDFLKTTGFGLAGLIMSRRSAWADETVPPSPKPNIVFILSDDVGLSELSCCGGDHFKTPNLDALAQSGTRFEQCYSTPLCGPSRCQILTGRYPFRTGLINNRSEQAVSPEKEVMIPTVMKKAGYVTASVGKWGQICLGPGDWGFDEHLSFKGSGRYWANQGVGGYEVNGQAKALGPDEYLPDAMHAFLADFIARNSSKPFYVHYAMSHVHGPILRTPDSKPGASKDELYADNVAYMDKLVGKLVAELDRLHLREKTLILFAGDNGTARFGASTSTLGGRPIFGMKASMKEGGSRVPLLVSWPGTTPAGKVNRDLTDFSDFFPTFAQLGQAPLPSNVALDGQSFAAQIRGEKGSPREWVYVELNGKSYARNARYKLTNGGELFDLRDAPFNEIPVPADTTDAEAIAARKRLQEVLSQHPAAPGVDREEKPARKNKPAKQKRKGAV